MTHWVTVSLVSTVVSSRKACDAVVLRIRWYYHCQCHAYHCVWLLIHWLRGGWSRHRPLTGLHWPPAQHRLLSDITQFISLLACLPLHLSVCLPVCLYVCLCVLLLSLALHWSLFSVFDVCFIITVTEDSLCWMELSNIFATLHAMQTQSSDEKAVRLSVCPSVKHVDCDKTEERSVQIFIPYERWFSLVFW